MNFSIVIPTTDRPKQLKRLLLSIKNIQYENKFEVVIVENGTNKSKSVINSFSHSIAIKYYHIATSNISAARNLGITKSKYLKLIFIDDDISVGTNFLSGYNDAWVKYPNHSMIAGSIIPVFENNIDFNLNELRLLNKYPWCFAYQAPNMKDVEMSFGQTYSSANFSFNKNSSLHFNENLGIKINNSLLLGGEDTEFCANLLLSNLKAVQVSDSRIRVKHILKKDRFTYKYLIYRHLKTGIELLMLENELIKIYGPIRYTYTQNLKINKNTIIRLLKHPFNFFILLSYTINKYIFRYSDCYTNG